MSGGAFDYKQYQIGEIVEEIQSRIEGRGFDDRVLDQIAQGIFFLRTAQIYAHRIDWLLSGDDGQESFLKRLSEELDEMDGLANESDS